jgi:hypothetical protein
MDEPFTTFCHVYKKMIENLRNGHFLNLKQDYLNYSKIVNLKTGKSDYKNTHFTIHFITDTFQKQDYLKYGNSLIPDNLKTGKSNNRKSQAKLLHLYSSKKNQ